MTLRLINLLICLLLSLHGFAGDRLKLERANKLKGSTYKGHKVNKVIGNVVFTQNDMIMYCDSAFQYTTKDYMEAFGNIKMYQGNDIKLFGDSLKYNGETKQAVVFGNVRLQDKEMTLTTSRVDYNVEKKVAYYNQEGIITENNTRLISQRGYYYSKISTYHFRDSVILTQNEYTLISDTLHYNVKTHLATFFGPTTVTSPGKYLYAERGDFNTKTEISHFMQNAVVKSDEYTITGDSIYFENQSENGYAEGNVVLSTIKDSITIYGGQATRDGFRGIATVTQNPIMHKPMNSDTLLLLADTLISVNDTLQKKEYLLAYHNVRIFKSNLQAICDSLVYLTADSIIHFYTRPVLWNKLNQITGDSIYITLKNNEIHRMYTDINAFLISHDTLSDYNQIKGRNMIAHFVSGDIEHVDVNGNGQTIYFARNDEKHLVGLNYIECSDMIINFLNNELADITFLDKADSKFIPPQEINAPEKTLKDFQWKIDKKPKKEEFIKNNTP